MGKILKFVFEEGIGDEEALSGKYTKRISAPIYVPVSPVPPRVSSLYSLVKTNELIRKINKATTISEEERRFLIAAAYRHTVFTYANIAEYYSHANTELQELMEDSALVVIDFNKAIELGFIQLNDQILDEFTKAIESK